MMTRLARERGRSALAWSLLGIATWIVVEVMVTLMAGLLYGLGVLLFDWQMPIPEGVKVISYILALVAALGSVTVLSRILSRRSKELAAPPLPPDFHPESESVI